MQWFYFTNISYYLDTRGSTHLYEVELSPAEGIADRRERGYSQQEIQAKSQYPCSIEGVITPGNRGLKLGRLVLLDLEVTDNKTEKIELSQNGVTKYVNANTKLYNMLSRMSSYL